jgi:hypothetical protein
MARTSKATIRQWLEEGRDKGATHMLVVSDKFDYEYYPVYVLASENVFIKADEHRTEPSQMRELMEVYSYALPLDPQIEKRWVFHYEVAEDVDGFPGRTDPLTLDPRAVFMEAGRLSRLVSDPMPDRIHWRSAVDQTVARLRALLPT